MAITMSSLLKSIKRRLGVTTFTLPLDDEELADIIYEETLPLFSIYFPHNITIEMDFSNNKVPGENETYYIDRSSLGEEDEIIGVENIFLNDVCGGYQSYGYPSSTYELFTDIQMTTTFESMLAVPITYYYVQPDKVKLESAPYNLSKAFVELSLVHPRNLNTIKIVYKEDLLKLALFDIKIVLYEVLKRTDKINTTFEQIDLRIDDWQNATADRETLLQEWDTMFLNSRTKKIYRV